MSSVSYQCPGCGARLEFDPALQKCRCEFCLGVFTVEQLEAAKQKHAAPEPTPIPDDAREYSCPGCGAHVVTDANTAATFCCYCHNPVMMSDRLSGEFRPSKVIPFQINRDGALAHLRDWCRKKKLLPGDFLSQSQLEKMTGIYIPYWLLDCDVRGTFSAEGDRVSAWADGRYAYTKTDIFQCAREADMSFRLVPHDASTKADNRVMEAIEPFDYNDLRDFAMSYLSGFQAEKYDDDRDRVVSTLKSRVEAVVKGVLRDSIQGYATVRERASGAAFQRTDCYYALLPVWLMTYLYRGQTYLYALNGQTGKAFGILPVSRPKLALLFGAVTAGVFALCFLGGLLL